METQDFKKLLLKAAFSCMVCDGDIDDNEVALIKTLFSTSSYDINLNIDEIINQFISDINRQGTNFLRIFLKELRTSNLTEEQEIEIIKVTLEVIYSDLIVKYSEIKFFKIIRSNLKISNAKILENFPSKDIFLEKIFEIIKEKLPTVELFLEEDIITDKYIARIEDDYFSNTSLPQFETIQTLDKDFLDSIKE